MFFSLEETMKTAKKKNIFFFLLLFSLLISSYGHQRIRGDQERKRDVPGNRREFLTLDTLGLPRNGGPAYASDQVLVKFKPRLGRWAIDALIAGYDSKRIKRIPHMDVYQIKIPKDSTVEEMVYALNQNPNVEYAEPNYIRRIAVTPNDPFFKYQYALRNTGQSIWEGLGAPTGTPDADIKATAGWEETTGSAETTIAIIDTGIDFQHPDLVNKIAPDSWDFGDNDADATDEDWHGTYVAGIAAADTDNSEGIAGVAWSCKILPLKVMDKKGEIYDSYVAEAIIWAIDHGAAAINLSLGGPEPSSTLELAVREAHNNGIVVAAAAGNDGASVLYPAAYDEYCLAVAATDYDDLRPDWSCFGPEVDVAAPGEWVLSAYPIYLTDLTKYYPYVYGRGTSASTPHVAGLAALIKSLKPWLTADEIMDVIRYSAEDVNKGENSGRDDFIGYGRIDMEKALVPIKITK